jgi:xanthine dehydrogenase accessory factor
MLDFSVTVLDDREEFATTERFDEGVVVRRADFAADPFAGVRIDNGTWIALVTRGHRWDFDCLRRLLELETRPRYIGMIGSRRRVRAAFHALLEAGTPRELLAAIHAPIGLELGAETPAEIAVSIAAEITALRRGVAAPGSTAERERVLDRLLG